MTHQTQTNALDPIEEHLAEHCFDGLAQAVIVLLDEVMKIEWAAMLKASHYQRTDDRRGYANGFKPKTLHTRLGALTVQVPQTRGVPFYPSALEKGVRSEEALKLAVAEMYVQGVSTREVAAITEKLCGPEVAAAQVSRAAQALDEEMEKWRSRPLGKTPYLILDARYEHVRHGGQVVSCAVLVAIGIDPEGKRSMPMPDCEETPAARLTGVPRGRCQFRLIKNAMAFVPKPGMRRAVVASIRAVFDAPDRPEAERQREVAVKTYRATAPKLADWLETNISLGGAGRLRTAGEPSQAAADDQHAAEPEQGTEAADEGGRGVPDRSVGPEAGQRRGDGDQRGVGVEPQRPDHGNGTPRRR